MISVELKLPARTNIVSAIVVSNRSLSSNTLLFYEELQMAL